MRSLGGAVAAAVASAVLAAGLLACGPRGRAGAAELPAATEVAVGERFDVRLESNPSTEQLVRLYHAGIVGSADRRVDHVVSDSLKAFGPTASRCAHRLIDGANAAWPSDRTSMRLVHVPEFMD